MKNQYSKPNRKKQIRNVIDEVDKKLKIVAFNKKFIKYYAIVSGFILLISVSIWTILSAKYNLNNADHLVNAQLFQDPSTFRQSILPGAHTFLIKWPFFLLIRLFGSTPFAYFAITYLTVLLTVSGLAYLVYRIDKRALVFGTVWMAMASVLLMVPIAPYSGALLPINMAMIATRNLEYLLFIGSILCLLKNRSLKSRWFWFSVILMGLLIASDKLFLVLAFGAAIAGLLFYVKLSNWRFAAVNVDWLTSNIFAAFISFFVLFLLALGVINIAGENNTNPYQFVSSVKDLALGIFYSLTGSLSNFGANPGYSTTLLAQYPSEFIKNLLSFGLFAYVTNMFIFAVGVVSVYRLVNFSTKSKTTNKLLKNDYAVLATMLVATTLAAFISFIFTKHYYVVDSRYLGIIFYTIFVGAAVYFAQAKKIDNHRIALIGIVLLISTVSGAVSTISGFNKFYSGVKPVEVRSQEIAQILGNHKVDALVGDYWRVVPAKLASKNQINIIPLGDCTQYREVLTSKKWQIDLNNHSFAYLLNLDGGNLTDFPNCTLKQVIETYGNPNSTVLVDGTLSQPKEYLLFYDHGIHKPSQQLLRSSVQNNPLQPISIDEIGNTTCNGPSTMNVVAHQDDDLLFMNPDILNAIKRQECVRTIYITAGDSGSGKFYYLSRQKGAQAAYSQMLGINDEWNEKVVKLRNNQYVTIAQPKNNKKISLVFLNLPDGNLWGQGFPASDKMSLAKLNNGNAKILVSLDGQSSYTSDQLVDTLVQLMVAYQPSTIRTQAVDVGYNFHDHSDHVTAGKYTKEAYYMYEKKQFANQVKIPILYYIGYPTHEFEPNVEGEDLQLKQAAFLSYAKYDGSVCSTIEECLQTPTYGSYLSRQYQNPE